jgi:cbb3-type cytochrome oxidase maturation protein
MMILVMMIPIAILLGASFLAAFVWATNSGQFDDTVTPAHRILIDEDNKEETL